MNKHLYLSVLIILGSIFSCFAQRQYERFRRFNIKDGLSNTSVWSVAQDQQGFLWMGTFDGLNRYDGYHFKIFKNNPEDSTSLAGNFINHIFTDSKERIWVCTFPALCLYNPEKENFKNFIRAGNGSTVISQVIENKQGDILVATASGLNIFDEKKQKLEVYLPDNKENEFTKDWVTSLLVDKKDNLWIGLGEKGLLLYEGKNRQLRIFQAEESNAQSLSDNRVQSIFEDSKGNIWVGTRNGLCRYQEEGKFFRYMPDKPMTEEEINRTNAYPINNHIFAISEDKEGRVWFGTLRGLHYFDPLTSTFKYFLHDPDDHQSISGDAPRMVFLDRFNHLWATGFGGADRLALYQKPFKNIKRQLNQENALLSNSVLSFAEDAKGNTWIGTNKGVSVWSTAQQVFYNYHKSNGLAGEVVTRIFTDKYQNVWIRPNNVPVLQRLDRQKDKFSNYTDILKNSEGKIVDVGFSMINLEREYVFYNSEGNAFIYSQEKDTFLPYLPYPAYKSLGKPINYACFDKLNRFWLLIGKELHLWDSRKQILKKFTGFTINGKQYSLENQFTLFVFVFSDHEDYFWLPTNLGLAKININTLETKIYTKKDGLETVLLTSMNKDKNNKYWLGSNAGIYQFDAEKEIFTQYTEIDGLPSTQINNTASFQSKNGTLFYGTQNGFTYFMPTDVKINASIPPIVLTDLQLFNQSIRPFDESGILTQTISQTKEITLSYEQSVLGLEYASLNYFIPEKVAYAYLLEGFDKDWNYVKNRRLATYTNLPRGKKFVFKVKATNEDGRWSEPQTLLVIEVTPPWWETWWFRAGVISLILISAYSYYKVRMEFLKKQNLKLEQQVLERTQEISKKSKDLEIANHEIKAKNEELKASDEEIRQNMEELETSQELLREQKQTIEIAFQQLHLQNTKVNDSIRYAQRIQNAILPHQDTLANSFAEHFVIFKPKDVVSGDFYWYLDTINNEQLVINTKKQNKEQSNYSTIQQPNYSKKKFLAVVDCTGHGVPGAFMSMIGNTLLHEIVSAKRIETPNHILEQLHLGVLNALNKKEARIQDGMDIALCCIENREDGTVKILFSGAKRTLYYFSNQTLSEIPADRKSIGQAHSNVSYQVHEITLQKGDILYMTSDGWIDAINPQRRRFGSQKFKEMLTKGANLPLKAQKEIFNQILEDYEQGAEQRDDILFVGVKV